MIFITPIIIILFSVFLIYKLDFFRSTNLSSRFLLAIFGLKLLAGLFLFLIYSYYYPERNTGDTFKYFDDGKIIFQAFDKSISDGLKMLTGINSEEDHLKKYYFAMSNWYKPYDYSAYNDNRLIIRINAFIFFISRGNFHVHSIIFNFLAFTGLTAIFKILKNTTQHKKLLASFILLSPSVLLWSSGVLKESILLFAFGMFLYFFFEFLRNKKILHLIFCFLFIFILSLSKIYVLLAIVPSLIAFYISLSAIKIRPVYIFIGVHLCILLFMFGAKYLSPALDIPSAIVQKQQDFYNVATSSKAESVIATTKITPQLFSFIKATPEAILNSLFRPFWWDVKKIIMLPNAIESSALLLCMILMMLFPKKPETETLPILLVCIFFSFTLAVLIGMTTPVIGAIVRYKIPFMPFLLTTILICTDTEKLKMNLSPSSKKYLHE